MDELPDVRIYTDGACDPNPGPGGWAALLLYKDKKKEISGSEGKTTNNRMELTAAVKALEILDRTCKVDIYTDSEYLKKGITEWLPEWRRRDWRRKKGTLANVDLWKALDISYDDFIQTTEKRHIDAVEKVLVTLHEKGDIYEDEIPDTSLYYYNKARTLAEKALSTKLSESVERYF